MGENLSEAESERTIIPDLQFNQKGEPFLLGSRCSECGAVYVGRRFACAHCRAKDSMEEIELAKTGRLYNWTIVYRNFPGIEVPFISSVVDLDGGGTLKGNLIGVEPDPEKIEFDMPVDVVFKYAENTDAEGNRYLSYFFTPSKNGGNA